MNDEDLLIEMIQTAVSEYACDVSDRNFEAIIYIKCEEGWTTAEILKSYNGRS
jgi:hypothetical protein